MRRAAAAGRAQPVVACHALARQMTGLLRHRNDNDLRRAKVRKKRGLSLGSGPLRDAQSNSGIFSLLTLTTPGAMRDTMLMEYEHQYALPPLDWTWEAPPPAAGFSFAWRRSGNGHVRALSDPATAIKLRRFTAVDGIADGDSQQPRSALPELLKQRRRRAHAAIARDRAQGVVVARLA